jgi:DNA (cytosine-5)-methyltransferase 1
MNSVELFVGAGGLALGISDAGFTPSLVLEWNQHACDTIRINQERGIEPVVHWKLRQSDVREIDFTPFRGDAKLVSGGPPCQPFSLGGKHRGYDDKRDMFPEAIRAVREIQPECFIFENVKGLTRQTFANYLEYIRLQMTHPDVVKKTSEEWSAHLARLERHHTKGSRRGLGYNVVMRLLNAANYGVPQCRERLFIVGFRTDIGREWSFPEPTHSREALLWSQWVTGEYWDRHKVTARKRPAMDGNDMLRVERMRGDGRPTSLPWRTVRDAIHGLPDPVKKTREARRFNNHEFRDGARVYTGHTGSPMDEPAKTLKAGDHGVPGGENMMVYPDGGVRYFTVRESARLQTFPDDYQLGGSWTEAMRQLGNAVPVMLGQAVAESVAAFLSA